MAIAVADRLAVRELVESYAAAADRRDHDLFRRLWVPGAILRVDWGDDRPEGVFRAPEQCPRVIDGLLRYERTRHVVANQLCRPGEDGHLLGEVYCEAHHLSKADTDDWSDRVLQIRYADRYQPCDDGWRFAARTVHVLWAEQRTAERPTRPRTSN